MAWTRDSNTDSGLPRELLAATPRPVRLNSAGLAVSMAIAALLAMSVLLPALLYSRINQDQRRVAQFAAEAVTTEAEVVLLGRPNDGRVRVTYRYSANGMEFTSHTRIRRHVASSLQVGSRVPIRYLASNPAQNWFSGQQPRSAPIWLVFLIPPVTVLSAGTLVLLIRRQTRLLAEGRAAIATVTNAKKVKGPHGAAWRVQYEWTLLSGARRSGRYETQRKTPPAVGTTIPVVYDRDNPQRHARYPMCLVHIPGATPRRSRVGKVKVVPSAV